jgi:hypothetical protein
MKEGSQGGPTDRRHPNVAIRLLSEPGKESR